MGEGECEGSVGVRKCEGIAAQERERERERERDEQLTGSFGDVVESTISPISCWSVHGARDTLQSCGASIRFVQSGPQLLGAGSVRTQTHESGFSSRPHLWASSGQVMQPTLQALMKEPS